LNGLQPDRISWCLSISSLPPVAVHTPPRPLGVAESWNWFIANTLEDRIIVNDDILFSPESLAKLSASSADIAFAKDCGFSCFLIRDSCVAKIAAKHGDGGLFDETISPGYAYYEDEDYLQRLDGRGTRERSAVMEDVDCGVVHRKSSTLQSASYEEVMEHHRRFRIAQRNYMKKWGLTSL
jgi:hypothetical protein